MTKKGHQKFSALKFKFLPKKVILKLWSAKFFPGPPKSAPSLRLWLEDSKEAQLRKINKLSDLQQTYSHSNLIMSIHNLTT